MNQPRHTNRSLPRRLAAYDRAAHHCANLAALARLMQGAGDSLDATASLPQTGALLLDEVARLREQLDTLLPGKAERSRIALSGATIR